MPPAAAIYGIGRPALSIPAVTTSLPSEPHPGLVAARPALAARPGPGADELRRAYLDLLKLSLCDLVGTTTVSVGRTEDGRVMSRELAGDQLRLRSAGMDWPLQGLTMIGLGRLDDLQSCVESVVRDGVEGDLIEAGGWRGGASLLMRATLDSLGDEGRAVVVADSFQGFPLREDEEADELGVFDFLAVPLDEVRASFVRLGCERGVEFVPGFFEDTLQGLAGRRWSLVRLDGDTYEATLHALECLYPGLSVGGYLVVDDYGALDECRAAVDEFRTGRGLDEPLEEIDWTGVRWRRERPEEESGSSPAAGSGAGPAPRMAERRPGAAVPSIRELELERELAEARARLERAEVELERLTGSPLAASAAWLRERVRR